MHRTRHPFVGAGRSVNRRTLPLPLRPAENQVPRLRADARPQPFTASELLDGVAGTVRALRESESLAPSARLRHVETLPAAVRVGAEVGPASVRTGRRGTLPEPRCRPGAVDTRGTGRPGWPIDPDETARLYHDATAWSPGTAISTVPACWRDRPTDAVSGMDALRAAPDPRELPRDRPCRRRGRAAADPALGGAPARSPLPVDSCGSVGASCPRTAGSTRSTRILYGAAESLRELAAETGLPEYFQRSDAELHIEVLEQAVLRGVDRVPDGEGLLGGNGARGRAHHDHRDEQRRRQRLLGREDRQRANTRTTTVDGPASVPRPSGGTNRVAAAARMYDELSGDLRACEHGNEHNIQTNDYGVGAGHRGCSTRSRAAARRTRRPRRRPRSERGGAGRTAQRDRRHAPRAGGRGAEEQPLCGTAGRRCWRSWERPGDERGRRADLRSS